MPSLAGRPSLGLLNSVSSCRNRRRFVAIGTAFYTGYLIAFLALLGYAPDLMSDEIAGISLALWGGLSICLLTVVMAWLYARRAGEWERMAQRVVEERADERSLPPPASSTPWPSASSPACSRSRS